MTPATIATVQDSFAQVAPIADTAADLFYAHLFETHPDLRPMFPAEMAEQKAKLMKTLAFAVNSLSTPETLLPALADLGARHMDYGVEPHHYDAVGASLIHTLQQGLGPAFTPEVKSAWLETYGSIASTMQDSASG